ncbi:MAG TPA: hypothetical protein VHF69_10960 [Candidatus Synoicihabitans sp.]|nr:hypothetical protein [Candidatus Synoicihabitans sp.]
MTADRPDSERRQEVRRLLAAAGQPATPDLVALEHAVRERILAKDHAASASRGNFWSTAALLAAGLAIGVVSAAWRVHEPRLADQADLQMQYLRLIDPLARPESELPS